MFFPKTELSDDINLQNSDGQWVHRSNEVGIDRANATWKREMTFIVPSAMWNTAMVSNRLLVLHQETSLTHLFLDT